MARSGKIAVAEKFAEAIKQADFSTMADLFAPGMTVAYNTADYPMTREQALESIEAMRGPCQEFEYEEFELLETEEGYVQLATMVGKTREGKPFRIKQCVVVSVSDNGKITGIREYLDSGQAQAFVSHMEGQA